MDNNLATCILFPLLFSLLKFTSTNKIQLHFIINTFQKKKDKLIVYIRSSEIAPSDARTK